MAARKKKSARKKTTRKKATRKKAGARLIKTIEKELASLSKTVDKRVAQLRRDIEKAERQAGSGGARVVREARRRLNAIEITGHQDWQKFLRKSRRDLSGALSGLERSVRPKPKAAGKKKTRKARKKTTRRKAR